MVYLTKLDGSMFVLNSDLIRTLEPTPDTLITLTNGDQFIVRESIEMVIDRSIQFQQEKGTPVREEFGKKWTSLPS